MLGAFVTLTLNSGVIYPITYMRIASLLSNILLFRKFEKSLENYSYCHANLQIRYSYIQKDAGALKVQTL